jgi:transposase-like protein
LVPESGVGPERREAARECKSRDEIQPKLTGTVEVDELYVGPRRPRQKGISKQGRGTLKTPVVGMVQRDGNVRFQMLERVTAENLSNFIAENADLTCRIITDDFNLYRKVGRKFEGGHEVVTHSAGEYVRPGTDVHSNTTEGVFSLIRRGVMGTFHSVSRKHLPNYLNEFQFRWDTRKMDDGQRVAMAIKQIDGKRLQYRESVDNPPYLPKPEAQMEAPF